SPVRLKTTHISTCSPFASPSRHAPGDSVDACSSIGCAQVPSPQVSSLADAVAARDRRRRPLAQILGATCAGGADDFTRAAHSTGLNQKPHHRRRNEMTQTAAMKLLNAATASGDGPVFNLEFPHLAAAVQAEIAGAPTQAVINVMALLD